MARVEGKPHLMGQLRELGLHDGEAAECYIRVPVRQKELCLNFWNSQTYLTRTLRAGNDRVAQSRTVSLLLGHFWWLFLLLHRARGKTVTYRAVVCVINNHMTVHIPSRPSCVSP